MELSNYVSGVNILNIDKDESTISNRDLISNSLNQNGFIVSDADEELLILIEFARIMDLQSIKIYSLPLEDDHEDISCPKQVHIYHLKHLNIDFDDVNAMKPDKSVECCLKKLKKGQNIALQKASHNAIKFKQTKHLAIYIQSNQADAEKTCVHSITLKGRTTNGDDGYVRVERKEDNMYKAANPTNNDHDEQASNHLLCPASAMYMDFNQKECDLSHCVSLQEMIRVLHEFHQLTHSTQEQKTVEYNDVTLLNHFNHLLCYHSTQFEDIYNMIIDKVYGNKSCETSSCLFMRRNQRNRDQIREEQHLLRQPYLSCIRIATQQLVDSIHCYLVHSFESGYKLTRKQKDCFTKMNEHEHKFQIQNIVKPQNIRSDRGEQNLFDYGYRFYYWNYSRNDHNRWHLEATSGNWCDLQIECDDWYIEKKYNNLKEELTQNEIATISQYQFDQQLGKAQIHTNTEYAKMKFCARKKSSQCYDNMYYKKPISLEHIISMMCFGMSRSPKERSIILYHGVDDSFTFKSMDANIKGPLSLTTNYFVACGFAYGNKQKAGMVLELDIDTHSWGMSAAETFESTNRITCMDMQWISDFKGEDEIFFIGGLSRMQLVNIHQLTCSDKDWTLWMGALRTLALDTYMDRREHMVVGHFTPSTLHKKMAALLLFCELSGYNKNHPKLKALTKQIEECPQFIKRLLHSHCSNVHLIKMGIKIGILNHWFKDKSNGWIMLDLLTTIFPNVESISYLGHEKHITWLTQDSIYESIIRYIERHPHTPLQYIGIACNVKHKDQVIAYISKYQHVFVQYDWKIEIEVTSTKTDNTQFTDALSWISALPSNMVQNAIQTHEFQKVMQSMGLDQSDVTNVLGTGEFKGLFIQMRKRVFRKTGTSISQCKETIFKPIV
eukprot:103996_1